MQKHTEQLALLAIGRQNVSVTFDGEQATSDAGAVLLRRVDEQLRLTERLAQAIRDPRCAQQVRHALKTLLRQRVFQISQGWPDCNDADTLRRDPAFKFACGRQPVSGADLASQPTLSRLENAITPKDLDRLSLVLLEVTLAKRKKAAKRRRSIVIDFDATDAQTHGDQQLSFFSGYYAGTCYAPLLIFDGDTGDLLSVMMRPGNAGTADEAVTQLAEVVAEVRRLWPGITITLRGDAGFAWPEVFAFCDAYRLQYMIAMAGNARLNALSALSRAVANTRAERAGKTRRTYGSGMYQSKTWTRPRAVIWKAEARKPDPEAPAKMDTRYVVTNCYGDPGVLYRRYCQRCTSENWIKGFKLGLAGDTMSCEQVTANHFRLLLHAAAYLLMHTMRELLAGTVAATWQFDTLRLRLLKVGGWVHQSVRRIVFHLAASHPYQDLWRLLTQRLSAT